MAGKSKMVAVKVGLGVAICDEKDDRFLKTKGLLQLQDDYMTPMDAEVRPGISLYPRQANEAKKESCVICFDDDIDFDLMFLVDECGHRFCFNCMKQHIEVKLLDGTIPNCLEHRCESQLSIDRCGKFLSLELSLMWKQRIKEISTPLTERVYCPYQSCAYLMSKTELSSSVKSGLRRCFKCDGSFCLHCKVPWHSTLSCKAYKKLHPSPENDDDDAKVKSLAKLNGWRQCGRCQYMVERSYGCNHIRCR
ncbi:E3 ubiquitin-protein ligase RSL1 [Cardamine amara subsp. amara]|uniref:RBR-type E3 ubiquitin transferase n=1 Tax=Cardamine amara subsp. amara TaxID=228776 RepID=A0ABD1APM7_CARAN